MKLLAMMKRFIPINSLKKRTADMRVDLEHVAMVEREVNHYLDNISTKLCMIISYNRFFMEDDDVRNNC